MIEKWEFTHFPCEKDPQRYKLKIKTSEEEVNGLIKDIDTRCGRPFVSLSKDFNWAFYVYQVEKEIRNKIIHFLKKSTLNGSVRKSALEVSSELPPALEEFLDATAQTLINDKMIEEIGTTDNPSAHQAGAQEIKTDRTAFPPAEKPPAVAQTDTPPAAGKTPPSVKDGIETREVVPSGMKLYDRYTFEQFVVGPNNRFTHAASQAVAKNPGKIYNPLFIYGGVGLGKTHLMQAIGHYVINTRNDLKVLYATTEKFMGEVIEAIGKGSMTEFRNRFRNIDLLLMDDIQFLSESEATQEEFFHLFNILHEGGKQIILTSDRPPKQLMTLEDRLRSRFEWGLIADIKSPNLETRVAILKKKSLANRSGNITEPMLIYIASKLKSNVRELEGFLKRIHAYADLTGKTVDMDLVQMIMKELLPDEELEESPEHKPLPPADTKIQEAASPPAGRVLQPSMPTPPRKTLKKTPPVPGTSLPSFGAEDVDLSLTPIEVGFFYPEGKKEDFKLVNEKFRSIIKKHKLKFRLQPVFEQEYRYSGKINYAFFTEQCKAHNARIIIVLGPPEEGNFIEDDFTNLLVSVMEDERISLQLVSWRERAKDYRYLNLSLDITLLRHRKPTM